MKLNVNHASRYANMRAHTATHLLHYLLHDLLGGTKQAGSLVDNDYLRFDFATKKPLTQEHIDMINTQINLYIHQAIPVDTKEMVYDEAVKTGAKAFFEDTYGDTVRVVSIRNTDIASIELCGGTHVHNTHLIGAFIITGQEAVASGIRRITAVTGPKVATYAQNLEKQLSILSNRLQCQPKQLHEKLEKILKEHEHIKSDHESLQVQLIEQHLQDLKIPCKKDILGKNRGNGCIINISDTDLSYHNFKEIITVAKQKRSDNNWIIYTNEGNFAIYTGAGTMSAKIFAQEQGLKGGGSDQLVQGRDDTIVAIFS